MDTITQAVLGAAVAEAGFAGRLGRKARWFGAACGLLPDLDVVTRVAGEWASLVHHRGPSHSLLVLPLVAPVVGALAWRWLGDRRNFWTWVHLAFWALVTHPLLDLFTTYGTQLFAPLSDTRFAADGVGIIDPIYTLPLVFALLKRNRRYAWVALVWSTAYVGIGAAVSAHVVGRAQVDLEERGFEPVAVRAVVPILFTPLRRVIARDAEGTIVVGWWSPTRQRIDFETMTPVDDPAIRLARESEEGQIFEWFADGYLVGEVEHHGTASTVRLVDMRYGFFLEPTKGPFAAEFTVRDGRVLTAQRAGRPNLAMGAELREGRGSSAATDHRSHGP